MKPARFLRPWDSPGKNTGMGCHALVQGIFPTQDQTQVSQVSGGFFNVWVTREALSSEVRFKETQFFFQCAPCKSNHRGMGHGAFLKSFKVRREGAGRKIIPVGPPAPNPEPGLTPPGSGGATEGPPAAPSTAGPGTHSVIRMLHFTSTASSWPQKKRSLNRTNRACMSGVGSTNSQDASTSDRGSWAGSRSETCKFHSSWSCSAKTRSSSMAAEVQRGWLHVLGGRGEGVWGPGRTPRRYRLSGQFSDLARLGENGLDNEKLACPKRRSQDSGP